MNFLFSVTAIAHCLDLNPTILKQFHILDSHILEYIQLIKELYKNILNYSNHKDKTIYDLKTLFEQIETILALLFSAGGDKNISPRFYKYGESLKTTFEDMVVEANIKILLKQLETILNLTGLIFRIDSMQALKIDEI